MCRPIHIVRRVERPRPQVSRSGRCRPVDEATLHRFCFEALCPFVPERSIAHSGGSGGTLGISWNASVSGARSFQYEVFGSGMGAMQGRDGLGGRRLHLEPRDNADRGDRVDVPRSRSPLRACRRLRRAGQWRGGLSYRREYEALAPAVVMRRAERAKFPATGVEGGWPGSLARVEIVDNEGCARQVPVAGRYELQPGERIGIQGVGAGGFGSPAAHNAELVRRDVESALVTSEGAGTTTGSCCGRRERGRRGDGALRAAGLTPPAPVVVAEGAP